MFIDINKIKFQILFVQQSEVNSFNSGLRLDKMMTEQDLIKKRQYESKIQQFLPPSQTKHKRQIKMTHNPLQQSIDLTQKTSPRPHIQRKSIQSDKKSLISYDSRSSTLKRKTSIYSNITQKSHIINQNQVTHHNLLTQIQSKISFLNQKISSSISQQQNAILKEYENKLKSKQQELNKLRLITNDQMIRQKTIERKQQLKRQKKALIQGNLYYDQKLKQLKKELEGLIDRKENYVQSIMLMIKENNIDSSQSHIDSGSQGLNNLGHENIKIDSNSSINTNQITNHQRKSKKKIYMNNSQYVETVLKNYNQKSKILRDSLSESQIRSQKLKSQQKEVVSTHKISNSILPLINQNSEHTKNNQKPNAQDFYTLKKVKRHFQRVKSIGPTDNMNHSSIQSNYGPTSDKYIILNSQSQKNSIESKYNNQNMNKIFRYNNKGLNPFNNQSFKQQQANPQYIAKMTKDRKRNVKFFSQTYDVAASQNEQTNILMKNSLIKVQNKKVVSSGHNKSLLTEKSTLLVDKMPTLNNTGNTKQYLQQFVLKKAARQIIKKQAKTAPSKTMQSIIEKQNLLNQKLKNLLKVQQFFRNTAQRYYSTKGNSNSSQNIKIKTQDLQQNDRMGIKPNRLKSIQEQQQKPDYNQIQSSYLNQPVHQSQQKILEPQKIYNMLQKRPFDKKLLMDLMFQSRQFKKYVYDIIIDQEKSLSKKQADDQFQDIMKRFQSGVLESRNQVQ